MDSPLIQIRDLQCDLAWRMLATHGAPVQAQPIRGAAVDPECVLILSSICAEYDARSAELALWFGAATHKSLSTTRATRIARDIGAAGERALARFGATAELHGLGDLRAWSKRPESQAAIPWGIDYSPDRLGERIGGLKSVSPALREAGALRLRLRMAIGVGARAEALAMLLVESRFWDGRGEGWLTLPQLEAGTSYGKRFLLDSLPDMASAGLILHAREGRSHRFAANPNFARVINPVPTIWGDWPRKLALFTAIEHALNNLASSPTITTTLAEARALKEFTGPFAAYEPPSDPDKAVPQFELWCTNAARFIVDVE